MSDQNNHYYALIMAGGGGTRLWPLSRQSRPKQMLELVEQDQTMFQMTVRRLQPLLDPSHVFVITGQAHVDALRASTPEVPAENFVVEPFGRDSGPAAALGSMAIAEKDPDAVIAVLSADHFIADTARFRNVLDAAAQRAVNDVIVTLGISASRPATEFGYIMRGELLGSPNGFECYRAANFTEKPNAQRALEFLSTGLYSWNSGMFIWTAKHILGEYERQQPQMYEVLGKIREHLDAADFVETITPLWEQMPKLSLDYAVMEGAPAIEVIPVDIGWSDIGSWDMLFDVLEGDADGNVAKGNVAEHIQIDTTNTMIVSDRMVATIGVDDLVIVDTEDVILVCRRERAQDVKEVVRLLKEKGAVNHL